MLIILSYGLYENSLGVLRGGGGLFVKPLMSTLILSWQTFRHNGQAK